MASVISINIMPQTNSSCFGKILVYNSKFTSIPVDRKVISWRQCSPPPPHYSFCTQFPNPVRKSGGNYYRPNILLREQIQTPTLNSQLMQVFYWSSQNYSQMIIIVQLLYNLAPTRQRHANHPLLLNSGDAQLLYGWLWSSTPTPLHKNSSVLDTDLRPYFTGQVLPSA